MTYDRQIATDFTTAVNDLHSKLAGMTGWGYVNDQSATGHVALSHPGTHGTFVIESNAMGDGTNASNVFKLHYVENYTDASTYSPGFDFGYDPLKFGGVSGGDSVQYWLQYTSSYGFVWYLRRDVGDGNDGSAWVGSMEYANGPGTEYWNPRNADSVDVGVGDFVMSGNVSQFRNNNAPRGNASSGEIAGMNTDTDNYGRLEGILNPDSAFNNYVWFSDLVYHTDRHLNDPDTGQQPVFASIDDPLFIDDVSGSDVNTGDVVQDSGGNDEWEIVDYNNNRVGIRMM
jgi:hypothetical protein